MSASEIRLYPLFFSWISPEFLSCQAEERWLVEHAHSLGFQQKKLQEEDELFQAKLPRRESGQAEGQQQLTDEVRCKHKPYRLLWNCSSSAPTCPSTVPFKRWSSFTLLQRVILFIRLDICRPWTACRNFILLRCVCVRMVQKFPPRRTSTETAHLGGGTNKKTHDA